MSPFYCLMENRLVHNGVRTGCHYLVCLRVCLTSDVFSYCESCTRPISTNPVSMDAGEYGLSRETCFAARRLETVAVAGLLCISRCVLGKAFLLLLLLLLCLSAGICFYFSVSCTCTRPLAARDPEQSSYYRLGEGSTTASQCAHLQRALIYLHQVYYLLCSHLINTCYQLISKIANTPSSQSSRRHHECNINNISGFYSASRHCSRDRTLRQTYARGI